MHSYIEDFFLLKDKNLAAQFTANLEIQEIFDTAEVLILRAGLLIYHLFGNYEALIFFFLLLVLHFGASQRAKEFRST